MDKAKVVKARMDIKNMNNALELFNLDNYGYPSSNEGLEGLINNPGSTKYKNWKKSLKDTSCLSHHPDEAVLEE